MSEIYGIPTHILSNMPSFFKAVRVNDTGNYASLNTVTSHTPLIYAVREGRVATAAPQGSAGIFVYNNLKSAIAACESDRKYRGNRKAAVLEVKVLNYIGCACCEDDNNYTPPKTRKDLEVMDRVGVVIPVKVAWTEPTEKVVTNEVEAAFIGSADYPERAGYKRIKLVHNGENIATIGANGLVDVADGYRIEEAFFTKATWMKVVQTS